MVMIRAVRPSSLALLLRPIEGNSAERPGNPVAANKPCHNTQSIFLSQCQPGVGVSRSLITPPSSRGEEKWGK